MIYEKLLYRICQDIVCLCVCERERETHLISGFYGVLSSHTSRDAQTKSGILLKLNIVLWHKNKGNTVNSAKVDKAYKAENVLLCAKADKAHIT